MQIKHRFMVFCAFGFTLSVFLAACAGPVAAPAPATPAATTPAATLAVAKTPAAAPTIAKTPAPTQAATPTATPTPTPTATPAPAGPGQLIFQNNCESCHALPTADELKTFPTDQAMSDWIKSMTQMAGLNADDSQKVVDYTLSLRQSK